MTISVDSTITPGQAAKLFLMTRGRNGPNEAEDLAALTEVISLYANKAYMMGLQDALTNTTKLLQEKIDEIAVQCGHRDNWTQSK